MLGLLVISSLSLSLSLSLRVSLSLSSRGRQCIVHVISFQKMYGLYGLKHHKVEKSLDVTIVTTTDNGRNLKIELEFFEFAINWSQDQMENAILILENTLGVELAAETGFLGSALIEFENTLSVLLCLNQSKHFIQWVKAMNMKMHENIQ